MNLESEIRDGYLVSAEMKKVWAVQIDMLKKLLQVCDKYGLRIFADGGTLLGTVRHKGYIPWDDDIDMVMLRDDYDRLVRVAPKEFDHPYFFQCGYTEKYYPRGHAQLRMDGTTAILANPNFVNTHQGIFVDIFPYDAVPDNTIEMEKQIEERDRLMGIMEHSGFFDWLHPFRIINKFNFSKLYSEFEDVFRRVKVNDNKYVSCFSFIIDTKHFLRDKHWYDETVYFPFEDLRMPVPGCYHEILSLQYGDYMTPVKAPSYHGGFWKLDPERSYLEYLPELRMYCNKERRRSYIRRIKKVMKKLL
jgi:lipopolysaccharide cholinephosphotransferase